MDVVEFLQFLLFLLEYFEQFISVLAHRTLDTDDSAGLKFLNNETTLLAASIKRQSILPLPLQFLLSFYYHFFGVMQASLSYFLLHADFVL